MFLHKRKKDLDKSTIASAPASNQLNKPHLIPLILATPSMFKSEGTGRAAERKAH
ncbi:hypothetical protein SAMN05216598_1158 [Pseudomonas asplenii]|uniref:Uncharacterized protein n=1 Tax=Pseudomonas asplenii TaxID=53407 RepID=A0A1H1R4B2_9PSED|nr:hypothetical protein SAMN05216598_1158 [Pseudomonas asplenii]